MRNSNKRRVQTSIRILQGTVILICLIILGRVYQLQILDFEKYVPLSRENSIRKKIVEPARGLIYDRHGNFLVENEPIYTITITPSKFDKKKIPLLARLTGKDIQKIRANVNEATEYSWQRPSRLFTEVDFETFSLIQENIWRLPGIGHQIESKRHYSTNIRASHILGYLREISEQQFANDGSYQLGDKVGKNGLEQVYQDYLRGDNGIQVIRVNAFGQSLGAFNNDQLNEVPVKGYDLITTLDTELQKLAETLMEGKIGGAVALDPNDGSVLALVSAPSYNIKKLAGRLDQDYWHSLNTDSTRPLFNRATMSRQPPGSTFKPMMALMGLNMGLISAETTIDNPGYYYRGRRYNDLAPAGQYNLLKALEKSSNTFFFWLMDRIYSTNNFATWHQLASSFGLGSKTGIDLSQETSGILPDSTYLDNAFGNDKWGLGDIINLGVGQGVISASPLQMSVVASALANGGYRVQPYLVKELKAPDGKTYKTTPGKKKIGWIKQDHLSLVQQGMRRVVTNGSGRWYANLDSIKVAGKTGTAQNPHGLDHAWFICFAPLENPQIAVAVLVENAGYGSISAAPIASLLIEKYLTGKIKRKWVYDRMLNFEPKKEKDENTQEEE